MAVGIFQFRRKLTISPLVFRTIPPVTPKQLAPCSRAVCIGDAGRETEHHTEGIEVVAAVLVWDGIVTTLNVGCTV